MTTGGIFLTLRRKFQYESGFISLQLPGKKAESEVPMLSIVSFYPMKLNNAKSLALALGTKIASNII